MDQNSCIITGAYATGEYPFFIHVMESIATLEICRIQWHAMYKLLLFFTKDKLDIRFIFWRWTSEGNVRGLNKMADILQTTLLNAFSWMKIFLYMQERNITWGYFL